MLNIFYDLPFANVRIELLINRCGKKRSCDPSLAINAPFADLIHFK